MLVFCRPCFDRTTMYTHRWCEPLISQARALGYGVSDLERSHATRQEVEQAVGQGCSCLIFYDHGQSDELPGQSGSSAVDKQNVGLLRGIPLYTLACSSCGELGPEAVARGATCYWGYDADFGFYPQHEAQFREQANIGFRVLLGGSSFAEAKAAFEKRCWELVDELERRGAILVADQLLWNMQSLKLLGDGNARLPGP